MFVGLSGPLWAPFIHNVYRKSEPNGQIQVFSFTLNPYKIINSIKFHEKLPKVGGAFLDSFRQVGPCRVSRPRPYGGGSDQRVDSIESAPFGWIYNYFHTANNMIRRMSIAFCCSGSGSNHRETPKGHEGESIKQPATHGNHRQRTFSVLFPLSRYHQIQSSIRYACVQAVTNQSAAALHHSMHLLSSIHPTHSHTTNQPPPRSNHQ